MQERGSEMASKEQCDNYATELTERFERLTQWAIENWPKKEFPLLRSDFTESRKEIAQIIGPKLGDCNADDTSAPAQQDDSAPFLDMNPMPWP
jgi:hypothetical protein